ncbi:LOB domain-containing protein 25-like isoform X1 [Primulina eburnea]|uniref:LOB domain-containing protein 25-like isoform X1 n=2 Tax=Primulina eburnea TaxID=1245227 RepID=UPI003C6BF562
MLVSFIIVREGTCMSDQSAATEEVMASTSNYSNPPCAACKFLRRKCLSGCIFAPYFPPEEPTKFANVHKIFGASNVSKLLNEIPPHQREDAVNSLAYEAEARLKDPVYGCVGAISVLQRQVLHLQKELDATNADLMRYVTNENTPNFYHNPMNHMQNNPPRNKNNNNIARRNPDYGAPGGSSFDPNSGFCFPYPPPWIDNPSGENIHDNDRHGRG